MLGDPSLFTHKRSEQVTVRTIPAVLGFGAGLAVAQGVFDYGGGKFSGYDKDPNVDEYDRKEALRKNRRRPIQETLEDIGEGRGERCNQLLQGSISINDSRYIWSRLPRKTSRQDQGELRHRRTSDLTRA